MSEFAAAAMNNIIAYANERLREMAYEFRDKILYMLKVHETEVAWAKADGKNYTELNTTDVMNNVRVESHQGDNGVTNYIVYIVQEFQNALDAEEGNVLWMVLNNARAVLSGGG